MSVNNCPFCADTEELGPATGQPASDFIAIGRRILEEGSHSYLAAGIGALVFPYVLFVTRRHVTGFDAASLQEKLELRSMLDRCLKSGLFPSGRLTLLEHGGIGSDSCNCVDHCHIHIVDGDLDVTKFLLLTKEPIESCPIRWDDHTPAFPKKPYLWVGSYQMGIRQVEGVACPAAEHGRQYFRRILAALIRSEQWDWRAFPNWDNIVKLVSAWRAEETSTRSNSGSN